MQNGCCCIHLFPFTLLLREFSLHCWKTVIFTAERVYYACPSLCNIPGEWSTAITVGGWGRHEGRPRGWPAILPPLELFPKAASPCRTGLYILFTSVHSCVFLYIALLCFLVCFWTSLRGDSWFLPLSLAPHSVSCEKLFKYWLN